VDAVEGLGDAARLARDCAVMGRAVALARWIGTGRRPVTPGQVLRKADVAAAGAALGVDVPARLRTMADIRALYRPWRVAVGAGLLHVDGEEVTAGPALANWPPDDRTMLAEWLAGLRAVCAAESHPHDEDSVRLLALALLTVLRGDGAPAGGGLWRPVLEALDVLSRRYGKWSSGPMSAADQYGGPWSEQPLGGLIALLAEFGAVAGDRGRPALTPLGRWAAGHLAAGLPGRADPGLPAGEMIAEAARFGDEGQQDHVARAWRAGREPVQAAREILAAAEGMSPLQRSVAVRLVDFLGDDALPAWREFASARYIGPFARLELAAWAGGPEPPDADGNWLGAEGAAAGLEDKGPDEALTRVWESMPGTDLDERLAAVRATGHRDAGPLTQAVAEFAASGAPRSIDQVAQLKVSLLRFRPAIWRRVLVPVTASLGDLHVVIQILFGWDGDHPHEFTLGTKRFSAFARLEETEDEGSVRIRDAAAAGGKIAYTYDFGTNWEHEITVEKTLPRDHSKDYPVCVAFRFDSPVEYWSEEEPEEPEPFGLKEVNRRLAALGRGDHPEQKA